MHKFANTMWLPSRTGLRPNLPGTGICLFYISSFRFFIFGYMCKTTLTTPYAFQPTLNSWQVHKCRRIWARRVSLVTCSKNLVDQTCELLKWLSNYRILHNTTTSSGNIHSYSWLRPEPTSGQVELDISKNTQKCFKCTQWLTNGRKLHVFLDRWCHWYLALIWTNRGTCNWLQIDHILTDLIFGLSSWSQQRTTDFIATEEHKITRHLSCKGRLETTIQTSDTFCVQNLPSQGPWTAASKYTTQNCNTELSKQYNTSKTCCKW